MNLAILVDHSFWLIFGFLIIISSQVLPPPPLELLDRSFSFCICFWSGYIFGNIKEFLRTKATEFLFKDDFSHLGVVAKEKKVKVVELSQFFHLIPGQLREVPAKYE